MSVEPGGGCSLQRPIARRAWLGSVAMGLGAAAMSRSTAPAAEPAAASEPGIAEGWIDAHVHVWTPDTARYPLAEGFAKDQMQPPSFTPEELFAHARPCGVSRVVLIQMSFYRYDNAYMLDTARRFPGVFSCVAIVDPARSDLSEAMDALAEQRVRGFRLAPGERPAEAFFDSEAMSAMWRHAAQRNLAMCLLINPAALAVADRMCERFPDTPVVVDHLGRVGIDGTIRKEDLDALCRLARHKKTHVKVSAFYALGKKSAPYDDLAPMIRRVLDAFGPERLMWASDCPFQVQGEHTYRASIDLVRDRLDFLSASDREWLLRRTAERVYFT